ncbi:MAG: discoidin domain-containing protein [Clostridiales bacterium]|jgi:hypothetical protein|nr:discoidin domain-containing protein [Clostridiales bacterium]
MSVTKKLSVAYLIVIALGACGGIVGLLLAPEPAAAPAGHVNTEFVTWVTVPAQDAASTPARFVLPEIEPFVLPEGVNLAEGMKVDYNDYTDVYPGRNAVDGRDRTYWEAQTLPSWYTVDMAEAREISTVTLQLPPIRAWGKRTQALSVSVSEDGENFTEVSPEGSYDFDNASGNGIVISFDTVTARFVRVDIKSNTGAKGGQISEISIFE